MDAHVRLYMAAFGPRKRSLWSCPRCGSVVRQMDRHRDSSGHVAKHCGCAVLPTSGMTPDQLAAHKRQVKIELKRKYRRAAAEKAGRVLMLRVKSRFLHDAHVEAFKGHCKAVREEQKHLHDAHVKRYSYVLACRARFAKCYAANPQAERERISRRRQALPDSYVIQNLKAMGLPIEAITPGLIALKREAMEYRRLSCVIKTTVKTHLKENHETVTKHT